MNRGDVMYKCPKCDRLISEFSYLLTDSSSNCPHCDTPIMYYESFKIGKSDDIDQLTIAELLNREIEKIYLDGYKNGYKECMYLLGY